MLRELYEQLTSDREGFLEQARLQSELTIPSLIPPDFGSSNHKGLYKPFQSLGAQGTNAITNKLVGALYPATEPFFKFTVNSSSEEMQDVPDEALASIDARLSALEQTILGEFVKRGDRAAITLAVKHLVVGGNALLKVQEETTTVYSLNKFVAVRDGSGKLLRVITKDTLSYEMFKEMFPSMTSIHAAHRGNRSYDPKTIDVFSEMCRKQGEWKVQEEAAGIIITDSTQRHPIDKPPFLALRFERIDGESYGRGYVENLYGDLSSLESLCQAMVEGSAINARVLFLVNPNGLTSQRLFEEAPNGGVIPGLEGDIGTAKVNKQADLSVTASQIERLEARLEKSFMLVSAVQRNAERVTATEINMLAEEIETTLGGVYSVLSEEFQRPFVTRLISVLKKAGKIPDLPEGVLDISIVTGTAGIGRGIDKERMVTFLQTLSQALGQDTIKEYVSISSAIGRLAASFGINVQGLIKTPEEMAQEQQAAQEQQMAETLGPQAIQAAGQVTAQQMKTGEPDDTQEQAPIQ